MEGKEAVTEKQDTEEENAKESGKKGTKESNPSKAKTNSKTGDESVRTTKMTEEAAQDAYAGKFLDDDEVYSYDFMTRLPDMQIVDLPSASSLRGENGKISKADVAAAGMKNARSVGTERDGNAYVVTVKNRYTGRDIQVTSSAIRHGLNGSFSRFATNAKLGAMAGSLVQNAVPVNSLNTTAEADNVTGTYAMAALTTDSEGRQIVAVITVEQRSNMVTGIESYDVTHAINGRKTGSQVDSRSQGVNPIKAAGGSQADARSQGINPIKAAGGSQADSKSQVLNLIKTAKVSVADFLELVKDTHRSILSDDVLNRLNLERPADGYYTDRVRYSTDADKAESVETEKTEHSESKISADSSASDSEKAGENGAKAESSESKSDTSDTSKDTKSDTLDTGKDAKTAPVENSPAPSGKYDESHPNKIAQWMAKETSVAIKALGVDNAEISIDYNMDRASNGYYLVKDGKRQIVLNGQLGGTTREGQVYSAQQNIRYVLGHELGHLVQGVGYTGDTNTYTRDILSVYQQNTGTTAKQVEAGVRDIMVRYMDEADRADSKLNISREDVTLDYAKGEYAANCLAEMLGDYNTLRKIARGQNRNIVQKAIDRVAKFRSEIIAERRKRSIQEHDAAAKRRGDNAAVNVNGNVNDWFMIANLYDEAAENLEETLRAAMKNAGKMKIAEENSAPRQSFQDKPIPSYSELIQKPDIDIVDIRGETVGSLKEQRQEFMQSDIAKRLTSAPIINRDTGEAVFVTSKTFTHSFSNNGLEQVAALKNLQQIVENAILTHRENSRSEKYDSSTGVFTLFAAVRTDAGVMPVILKVKEYLTSGGGLPTNVMDYVSANNASEYAKLYDSRVLVLDDIEKEDASSSAGPNLATGTKFGNYPLASSKISIADLYDLVNESYKKYLHSKTGDTSTRYSLMAFEDGKRFVDVQTDQSQFDGLSEKESGKLATKIIKSRFAGKVIGTDNRVFVNGRTASEYTMPSRKLNGGNYEAKMRASTELDNLIDTGTNFRTEADGKDGHVHPNMTGNFQYFDTIFKVGDEYYKGVINIMPVERGLLLKDITKIENVTQDTCSSYGENPKSTFLRDISMDSIRSDGENVNPSEGNFSTRHSLSDDTDETGLPGWDEGSSSKFDQFTDTYEKGTNLIGKSKSIQAADELKREYGSRANIQSIATKYRQMSAIAEQFSNVHLDGMMGEELLGKENRTRTYEETQLPTTNRAAVFHRLVIARAGCTTQKRQSIRTTAFNDAI